MAEKRLWKAVLGDRGAGEQENEKTGDTRREQEAESRERGVGGTVDGERCGAEIWQ
jgi:hypothetical protein